MIEPAVLTDTSPNMRVNNAEIFGPVVTVEPYESFDEAVASDQRLAVRTASRTDDARRRTLSRLRSRRLTSED